MHPRWVVFVVRTFFAVVGALAPGLAGRVAMWAFCTPRRHNRPAWETRLAASGRPLDLGPTLAARAWGDGPVVLLVHGWEGRGTQLGHFVEPLVAAGFRAVALDNPAHGESAGRRTDLIESTEAVRKVARDLGPLAGIVAHSFGGPMITLALERGLDARAVVLIAAPSSVEDVITRFGELTGLRGRAMAAFRAGLEHLTGVPIRDVEIFERVAGLRVPALVIHDRGDREVPFHDAERLAERWPGARLLATEGLGHRRILKDPAVVGEAVAFLVQNRGS